MKIQGVLLSWGKSDRGYRWADIEGLRLDIGKDGITDSVLDSLEGREVVAVVQVQWVRSSSGKAWPRRRVLTIWPVQS